MIQIRRMLAKHWISLFDLGKWETRKATVLFSYPLLITVDLAVFNSFSWNVFQISYCCYWVRGTGEVVPGCGAFTCRAAGLSAAALGGPLELLTLLWSLSFGWIPSDLKISMPEAQTHLVMGKQMWTHEVLTGALSHSRHRVPGGRSCPGFALHCAVWGSSAKTLFNLCFSRCLWGWQGDGPGYQRLSEMTGHRSGPCWTNQMIK